MRLRLFMEPPFPLYLTGQPISLPNRAWRWMICLFLLRPIFKRWLKRSGSMAIWIRQSWRHSLGDLERNIINVDNISSQVRGCLSVSSPWFSAVPRNAISAVWKKKSIIWNRRYFKRIWQLVPESLWIIWYVRFLRWLSCDLWRADKKRSEARECTSNGRGGVEEAAGVGEVWDVSVCISTYLGLRLSVHGLVGRWTGYQHNMGQNNQESRQNHWATCSSIC